MKKNKAAVTLLLTLALTGLLLFTAAVGWGTDGAGAAKDIKLGYGGYYLQAAETCGRLQHGG